MPINIGDSPDHGFDQPLALMRDCHRRVEKFLGVLLRVASTANGGDLNDEYRHALETGLRYFRNAAPWHTRDEEDSLFPRMREIDDDRVRAAVKTVDALEHDHREAKKAHDRVEFLGTQWLSRGALSASDIHELRATLQQLGEVYARHIAIEDNQIFPLALQHLADTSLMAIGREMAERRGVDPQLPPRRCKHAGRHASVQSSGDER